MMTKVGIVSIAGGLLLALFGGISQFMGSHNFLVGLTISRLIGEDRSDSIIFITEIEAIQNFLDFFIYVLPLYGILFGLGILLFGISMFVKDH